jgi:hypothetical protein
MQTQLGTLGYKINIKECSSEILAKIYKDLNVVSLKTPNAIPIRMYYKKGDFLYLPSVYAKSVFGEAIVNKIEDIAAITSCNYNKAEFPLFPRQREILSEVLPKLHEKGHGILSAGCAAGKTGMSIYLKCKLRVACLIIIPRIDVLNQWIAEIHKFTATPKATYVILKGEDGWKKVMETDPDFVITTMHTFSMHKWPSAFLKRHGFVVYDECQHMFSREFSEVFMKLTARYMLGLSATAVRTDRLDVIGRFYLGESLYKDTFQHDNDIKVIVAVYAPERKRKSISDDTSGVLCKSNYGEVHTRIVCGKKAPDHAKIMDDVINNIDRNRLIIDWVITMAKGVGAKVTVDDDGKIIPLSKVSTSNASSNIVIKKIKHKILVISNRIDHLKMLQELLAKKAPEITSGIIRGQMSIEETDISKDKQVIFGYIGCVKDAFSVATIDCMLLATSVKNILVEDELGEKSEVLQQIFGRPTRKSHNHPVHIAYIADNFGYFKTHTSSFIEYCKRNPKVTLSVRKITDEGEKIPIFSANTNSYPGVYMQPASNSCSSESDDSDDLSW